MRRWIALVLLVALSLQSSSAAVAAGSQTTISPQPLLPGRMNALFGSVANAISGSVIMAALTGNLDRYNLEHQPAPQLSFPRHDETRPTGAVNRAAALQRLGIADRAHTLDPHAASGPDPLATTHPSNAVRAGAARATAFRTAAVRSLTMGALPASTTGISPVWTYEEGGIPGVGQWMSNVENGEDRPEVCLLDAEISPEKRTNFRYTVTGTPSGPLFPPGSPW